MTVKPINLLLGHPSISLLPTKQLTHAVQEVFKSPRPGDNDSENRHPLAYGPDQGAIDIRNTIGKWSAQRYGEDTIPGDHLHITGGASAGLLHALQQLTDPQYTKRAFVISPVYYLASSVFEDAGYVGKMSAIPEGNTGCDLEMLKTLLAKYSSVPSKAVAPREGRERKMYKYVLYCVPTFSNPTGRVMDLETRKGLVQLAREFDILIISDDVYDFLHYTTSSKSTLPPRIISIDKQDLQGDGNVLSNCTFSKLLGPGLRCGWIESPSPKLAYLLGIGGANHSGGCASQWTSFTVEKMILGGETDAVISHLQETYGNRAKGMKEAIESRWGNVKIIGGHGGYFMWVRVDVDARELVKRSHDLGVILANGDIFECPGDELGWGAHWVRVSVSYVELSDAVEAINMVGDIVDSMKK